MKATGRIAQAVDKGLADHATVQLENVAESNAAVPDDVDLLVVGGPTHAFSMSRASTREEAAHRKGDDHVPVGRGIRDWLNELPRGEHPQTFAAFDTRMDMPLLTGAASRSATRAAKHLGFTMTKPNSFIVESYEGPLRQGEIERAEAWGAELAEHAERGAL